MVRVSFPSIETYSLDGLHKRREDCIFVSEACTKKPTFNQFSKKNKDEIAQQSVKIVVSNAITLMRHWIAVYNRVVSKERSTVKLFKSPKTASIVFKLQKIILLSGSKAHPLHASHLLTFIT